MLPTWLSIELALIPVALAGLAGILQVVRLSERVKTAQSDATRALDESAKIREHQASHHERLYRKLEHLSNCTHLMMGSMGLEPPDPG